MFPLVALVTSVALFAADAQDPIPDTRVDNWVLATAAVCGALVVLAAAAKKPPVKQIGKGVGWVLRRLIGEPLGDWLINLFTVHARVIVREELEPAVRTAVSEALALQSTAQDALAAAVDELVAWRPTIDEALRELRATVPHVPTNEI